MTGSELDPASGVPLYRQIKDILREEVRAGRTDAWNPLTEAQLLERFGVSRAPVRQALAELTREGYVYRKQGKGTFPVRGARVHRPAAVPAGHLSRYLSDSGLHPTTRVSGLERVLPTEHVRERLSIEDEEQLLHFVRLIRVENAPLVEADVWIRAPHDFCPTAHELEQSNSAFELLEQQFGIELDWAQHEAWATAATRAQAQTLRVEEGSPLLVIETTFFTRGGVPAGWRSAVHQAEDFRYQFLTHR